jgi:hypothetical protein
LFDSQQELLRDLLERAVAAGELSDATDTADAARAMHAYIEGVLLVSKNANDASIVRRLLPLALRLAVQGTPVEAPQV